jgi:regulator of protease activity HflC (stomatin/prohibitin superfamily)
MDQLLSSNFSTTIIALVAIWLIFSSIKIVPQQEAWIIERLGKFRKTLQPGLNIILPYIDRLAYKHSLKEQAMDINAQSAISKDNVILKIDGVLYMKIIDPVAASYGVSNPYYAVIQLAQTTMRSEIGRLTLERTFEEREILNANIVTAINFAAKDWGISCMRHEIKDIQPPETVLQAMELQIAADRQKRAAILESEGKQQAKINNAEADKREKVLDSEAAYIDKVNRAKGEAESLIMVANATAQSISIVAESLKADKGADAVMLKLAENYITQFGNLAKTNNTMILPSNVADVSSVVSQGLAVYQNLMKNHKSS